MKLSKILLLILIISIFVSSVDAAYRANSNEIATESCELGDFKFEPCERTNWCLLNIGGRDVECCINDIIRYGGDCTDSPVPIRGCTDPAATNYDAAAKENDGSCTYPVVDTPTPVIDTTPVVNVPSATDSLENVNYIGCFVDSGDRALPTLYGNGAQIPSWVCADFARSNGHKYFGMQYPEGNNDRNTAECWTGDSSYNKHSSVGNSECSVYGINMGSGWRNAVYELTDIVVNEPEEVIDESDTSVKKQLDDECTNDNECESGNCLGPTAIGPYNYCVPEDTKCIFNRNTYGVTGKKHSTNEGNYICFGENNWRLCNSNTYCLLLEGINEQCRIVEGKDEWITPCDGECDSGTGECVVVIEEPEETITEPVVIENELTISITQVGGDDELTCESKCNDLGKSNSGCFLNDELPSEFSEQTRFDLFGILKFGTLGCESPNNCYCWNENDLENVEVVEDVPEGQIGSICNGDGNINHDYCESQFCSKNTGNGIVCEDRCTKLTVNSCGNGKCMNYPICEGASCGTVQRDCVNKGAYSNLLNQMFSIISNDNSEENVEEMRRIVEQYNLKGLGTTVRSSMSARGYTGFAILDSCSSDFNENEEVDFDDFFLFADYFGQTRESDNWDSKFDLSENGIIDFDDFFIFSDNFGKKANCNEEIISCTDSDGGKNYGVKGTVTSTAFGGYTETDYCLDSKKLKEFYCSEVDKSPDPTIITCENGCNGGICMETVAPPAAVLGCTDSNALNYNSEATQEDGSCTYAPVAVLGCTDNGALNYNPNANQDDGSCTYFACYDGDTNDGEKRFGDYSCDTSECPCDYDKLKENGRSPLNVYTGKEIKIEEENGINTFKLNISGDYIGRDSVQVIVRDKNGNAIVNKNFNLIFKEKGSFLDNSNRITSGAIVDITGKQTYQEVGSEVTGQKSRISCSLKPNPSLCCPAGYEESNGRCVVQTPRYCADFNNDNKVNFEDFFLLSDSFGSSNSNVDIDNDGKVDFNDFFIFADEFGKEPSCDGTGNAICTDSDGGEGYYEKNYAWSKFHVNADGEITTSDSSFGEGDECCTLCDFTENVNEGTYLREGYCDENGVVRFEKYLCPSGCSNGACLSEVTEDDVNGVQEFITLGDSFIGSLNDDYGTLKTLINMNDRGLNVETSLTSNEDDYMTNVVLEVARDSIKYHLTNNGLIGETFNLMGNEFKIISMEGDERMTLERNSITETVRDGDAFIGEDNDDPDWIWDFNLNNNIIGIENDFIYNDDSDNPPGLGDCINLPNNYAKICLNGLTVGDSQYDTYTIEYDNSADLSDADGSLTSEETLYIHSNKQNAFTFSRDEIFPEIKTNKIWIRMENGVPESYYQDINDNKIKKFDRVYYSGFTLNNGDLIFKSVGTTTYHHHLVLESTKTSKDNLIMYWGIENGKIKSLGQIGSFEEANELYWGESVTNGANTIGTKDEDHMTAYGIIVRDPKAHGANDEVVLDIPDRQVKASVIMEFN